MTDCFQFRYKFAFKFILRSYIKVSALATDGTLMHETSLTVQGIAHVVGEKPALAGGTMAIPDDFVRQRKYVRADEVAQATLAMVRIIHTPLTPLNQSDAPLIHTPHYPKCTPHYPLLHPSYTNVTPQCTPQKPLITP